MVAQERNRRGWGARVLAPLAFFAAATVLVLVVHRSLTADETRSSPPAATTVAKTAKQKGTRTTTRARPKKTYYRVKEGDFLETIAARFDTTVENLRELNPGVDPNALAPGERIRVR
ncbi:MAG: LysM peptidoglycan-binding domain-containing protein [Actinomycetota bacterium]|nr:LysM peptidoglycan-binding domain-containing protein [Actinomycetota bacterium]